MAIFFTMPKLGLNMTEGHIIRWLAAEGAVVKTGQPIIEIETDKASNEVEAPASGIIGKLLHQEGADVPCNGVLAVILAEGETLPPDIPAMIEGDTVPKSEVSTLDAPMPQPQANLPGQKTAGRVSVSPSARKLAGELGVDLSNVLPAGSQIKRRDVERIYSEMQQKAAPASESAYRKIPYTGIRQLTGEHMAASVHTTARVALTLQVNAEALAARKKALDNTFGKFSYTLLIAEQTAKALEEFPFMNSRLAGNEIREIAAINFGIAVDTDRGLLVPVIKNLNKKTLEEAHKEFTELIERAVSGKSSPQDLEGGTFTITNLGAQEIEFFVPVINLPECAILAVGAILPKAVAIGEEVAVCKMMALTLVFDHRIVDGAAAAKFLQRIKHLLEEDKT